MKTFARALAQIHRYSGLFGSLLFAMWFVSGFFMLYVEMPYFRQSALAFAGDPPVDLGAVLLTPEQAFARASGAVMAPPERVRLVALQVPNSARSPGTASTSPAPAPAANSSARPVYRFMLDQSAPQHAGARPAFVTVFADTGAVLPALSADDARTIAVDFLRRYGASVGESGLSELPNPPERIAVDQWTLYGNDFAALRPFYRFARGDAAGTEIYVSASTGKVAQMTVRADRLLAWAGPVVHWLYFASLRQNASLWATTVLWLSGAGMLVAFSGLALGFWRMRGAKRRGRLSPFRENWMRWHHWLGLGFGLITCTWIFSGWMSMTPFDWAPGTRATSVEKQSWQGGRLELERFTAPLSRLRSAENRSAHSAGPGAIREIEFVQIGGAPHLRVSRYSAAVDSPALPASALATKQLLPPLSVERSCALASGLQSRVRVLDCELLPTGDAYYYAKPGTRFQFRALPVVRLRFDDAVRHAYYIDPKRGQIVMRYETRSRWNRWLYQGLHSLSIPGLYESRPGWNVLMIALLIGGLALSLTSIMLTVRRLRSARK